MRQMLEVVEEGCDEDSDDDDDDDDEVYDMLLRPMCQMFGVVEECCDEDSDDDEVYDMLQRHMRQMLEVAQEHNKKKLRTQLIADIYNATTEDAAQKCIKLIPLEKGKCWYVSFL